MDERRLELKIGLLVIAAVGGVAALLLLTGELSLTPTSRLAVDFAHSGSVVEGAPVKLAGIHVGRISAVKLYPERRDESGAPLPVQVELSIRTETFSKLSEGIEATVATQGPLGEPYVELTPALQASAPLREGQAIRGRDPVRLEILFARMGALLDAFGPGTAGPGDVVAALASVGRLAARVDELLAGDAQDVKAIATELTQTIRDVRAVTARLRETLEPGGSAAVLLDNGAALSKLMRTRAPEITEDAARALEALAAVSGPLTREDGERLKATLTRVAQTTESLESLAARGERLLSRIEAGEGTLGALQKDAALYEELRALVTDLRKHPWKVLWKD